MTKYIWPDIVNEARTVAGSYSTAVTLRQLHYRLVSTGTGGYDNTESAYKGLSRETARLRRFGMFPALSDRTRGVERPNGWNSPAQALEALINQYRRDRTEDQDVQTWVLYEKATLGAQIEAWTWDYSIPTAALRGYSSESLEREVFDAMTGDGRPAVVFYLGDLDPEGEDIERNFRGQAVTQGIEFKHWERLTVKPSDVTPLGLVPNPGKVKSSRAAGFVARHGSLFQIEVEAVDPALLEWAVVTSIKSLTWFDQAQHDRALAREKRDIAALRTAQKGLPKTKQ